MENNYPICCDTAMNYVYMIAKNGVKMYFRQCFSCGKTSEKFISPKLIHDLSATVLFDPEIEKIYRKENRPISKRIWHDQNREKAWIHSNKTCGECKQITECDEGLIHHTAYPHGVYERQVEELIDNNICIWVHKTCHDLLHTANTPEEAKTGFYKIKGTCDICNNITVRGWERAKDLNLPIECICEFCANGTMDHLKRFILENPIFKFNQLRDFFENSIPECTIKNRRKRATKLRRAGVLVKNDDQKTYSVNEQTHKFFKNKT